MILILTVIHSDNDLTILFDSSARTNVPVVVFLPPTAHCRHGAVQCSSTTNHSYSVLGLGSPVDFLAAGSPVDFLACWVEDGDRRMKRRDAFFLACLRLHIVLLWARVEVHWSELLLEELRRSGRAAASSERMRGGW